MIRDKTGREIRVGDLLKSFHFIGARRKRYWMYHVVYETDGRLMLAHPHEIPTKGLDGCLLRVEFANESEIIHGYACQGDEVSYEDRPRFRS